MEQLNLAIIGCGGMGTRHMYGVKETAEVVRGGLASIPSFRLAALCDPTERNREALADLASQELGERPRTFETLGAMLEAMPEVQAVDIATETRFHHTLAIEALEAGSHVMVEKPMALTVTACNRMMAAAERAGRVLAVAENYRRDPLIQLVRALVQGGAIGDPWMLVDASIGGAGRMVITPWRHLKAYGNVLLDVGVHNVDLMLYEYGPIDEVYAQVSLFDRIRQRTGANSQTSQFYAVSSAAQADVVEADVADTAFATLRFRNGALGQWTLSYSGHGQGFGKKALYGSRGSIEPGPPRSGRGPSVFLDGRKGALEATEALALVPEFTADEAAARLFGGQRLTSYSFEYP
ncbi:MAG TPA: Gfo/Idh/MocA family oxidoreductase, partial [Chloroflexota bacterium]|nr:Gfo/Idh/MocA family oxidoreductase [Chloroflexota bacterium]